MAFCGGWHLLLCMEFVEKVIILSHLPEKGYLGGEEPFWGQTQDERSPNHFWTAVAKVAA